MDDFRMWRGIIRNEEEYLFWDNQRIERHPLSRDLDHFKSVGWFDFRCVGLFSFNDFTLGAEAATQFEVASNQFLTSKSSVEVVESSHDSLVLRRSGAGKFEGFYSVQDLKAHPFIVPRSRRLFAVDNEKEIDFDTNVVVWKEIAGIDLPVRYEVASRDLSTDRYADSLVLTFEWLSANEEIPVSVFELTAWNLRKGTSIYSRSNGDPILEKIVGLTEEEVAQSSGQFEPKNMTTRWPWLVGFIAAFALLFISYFWLRRNREAKS